MGHKYLQEEKCKPKRAGLFIYFFFLYSLIRDTCHVVHCSFQNKKYTLRTHIELVVGFFRYSF